VKTRVDEFIRCGLSNYKIRTLLEEDDDVPESAIPEEKQLTNRRYYLKKEILKELNTNTKGGFTKWLNKHSIEYKKAEEHRMLVIASKLDKNNFILVLSTKAMLNNLILQAQGSNYSFLSLDATHKLMSCQFKLSTFATSTFSAQIADVIYEIHCYEDAESYSYIFSSLKKYLKENLKFKWDFKIILSY